MWMVSTSFGDSYTYVFFVFEKHQNFNVWKYFKVPLANCLWADLNRYGRLCYITSGWEHAQSKHEAFKTL
jgi:hypothetical protein